MCQHENSHELWPLTRAVNENQAQSLLLLEQSLFKREDAPSVSPYIYTVHLFTIAASRALSSWPKWDWRS